MPSFPLVLPLETCTPMWISAACSSTSRSRTTSKLRCRRGEIIDTFSSHLAEDKVSMKLPDFLKYRNHRELYDKKQMSNT